MFSLLQERGGIVSGEDAALIEAPHHFRVSLNGHLVESSQDEFEASSRAFSRMTQTGYYTHAVENDTRRTDIFEPTLIAAGLRRYSAADAM
jgi:hypothetical protein